jgi:uroporphyrinogen-III synthase
MLEFDIVAKELEISGYDLLLFTSKNSVYIIDDISQSWKNIPSIAIGEESAKVISKLGGNVALASSGYSRDLALQIKEKFTNKKILYIRPKVVATDHMINLSQEGIAMNEVVLYDTVCKKYDISQKPSPGSVLIFTSPSTINCFIDNFNSLNGYKIVVIGTTTANALPCNIKYTMPKIPKIDECIKVAKEL